MQIIYGNATQDWYTLFSKSKSFIHRVCSFLSFLCWFVFKNCLLSCGETNGQTCIQENGEYFWHIVTSVAQQRNPVGFSNSSCKKSRQCITITRLCTILQFFTAVKTMIFRRQIVILFLFCSRHRLWVLVSMRRF